VQKKNIGLLHIVFHKQCNICKCQT